MNNVYTILVLFAVFYLVPLSLMFVRRVWIKLYFGIVLAVVLSLAYQTHVSLQAEEDCRAGCALAISAMALTIATVVVGSLLAVLSAMGIRRWRAFVASKGSGSGTRKESRAG